VLFDALLHLGYDGYAPIYHYQLSITHGLDVYEVSVMIPINPIESWSVMRTSPTWMHPPIAAYDSKVKLFFSIITFNTYDEWTIHHDMSSMSFTEVLTWINEGVDHAWKGWIMKYLDWGPNTSAPYAPTRSPRYLWYKETKKLSPIRFGKADSDFRNNLHQNHHRDHIRTLFWTFFIWMES
jgi:hypothetical protein